MKLWLTCVAAALAVLVVAPCVRADIAPPPPYRNESKASKVRRENLPSSRMTIESRKGAIEATLQIPRSKLKQLRAELDAADAPLNGSTESANGGPPFRTVVGGLFLFLSLAVGGVWVARTRRSLPARAIVSALLILAAAGAGATIALANIAPPSRFLNAGSLPRAASTQEEALTGVVRVEVVADGDEVKLIVPSVIEER
ncbi:MAG TPA: hypothetical protein VM934_09340 [Pyrinomonadaceae bacterium]|jgi:hypothetical protein|nr:hypothetical protein [Pyrinomonadaceae bacterium]